MASRLAPGRHDASCVLVVKLNSATRLLPLAGQPKPMRASLLTQVCGTAVRWPLARETRSSCTALLPFAVLSLKLTWITRELPSGLKAALATELAAGKSADARRPLARFSTCTRQRATHDGDQAIWVALAAITPSKVRLARGAAGSHSLSAIVPARAVTGTSNRPRLVPCSIRYPAGSLNCGPSCRPAMLTSRATPAAVRGAAPGGLLVSHNVPGTPGATASASPARVADRPLSARK